MSGTPATSVRNGVSATKSRAIPVSRWGQPPYGYIKDPDNPKRWIVDETAATVVRKIYCMSLDGMGIEQIADALMERLKKKHRADEMREVMEADMKYLKALMFRLEKEKQEGSSSGVSLQLSGVDMPVQSVSVDMPIEATTDQLVVAEGGSIDISV